MTKQQLTEERLRQLYTAPKNGCTHLSVPREGYYKIETSHSRSYFNNLPLTTFALWKPLGATKSTPGIEVEMPMLALILSNGASFQDKLSFLHGELANYILIVQQVSVIPHSQLKYNVHVKWTLKELKQNTLAIDPNELLLTEDASNLIDGFLLDETNHNLFLEPEMEQLPDEDYEDLIFIDNHEPEWT